MAVVCEGQIEEVHVDDIGTDFQLTIKECIDGKIEIVNVQAATDLWILFKKGDGTFLKKIATLVTDGTDGKIRYVSQAGDLDVAGDWEMQGRAFGIGGFSGSSSTVEFPVHGNLE
jgi:hypothetical protein